MVSASGKWNCAAFTLFLLRSFFPDLSPFSPSIAFEDACRKNMEEFGHKDGDRLLILNCIRRRLLAHLETHELAIIFFLFLAYFIIYCTIFGSDFNNLWEKRSRLRSRRVAVRAAQHLSDDTSLASIIALVASGEDVEKYTKTI